MSEIQKINILGTEYSFIHSTEKDDPGLCDKSGYCDMYDKRIVLETELLSNHPDSIRDMEAFKNKVKRHELIHAFFAESGLCRHSDDEQLVDWIAWQFPKLLRAFEETGAI